MHTNHYVAPSMLRYETDPSDIAGSAARYGRARALLASCERPVTPTQLRGFLADRAGAPDCLCKDNESVQTVFWCVIGLHQGSDRVWARPARGGEPAVCVCRWRLEIRVWGWRL